MLTIFSLIWFFFGLIVLCLASNLGFFLILKKDKNNQNAYLKYLRQELVRSQDQLKKRQVYLSRYEFSEYNLSKALIIQPEIKLH